MSEIQSLARGLKIMEIMADVEHGIGVTELADHLGVNKGTASRMVQTLAKYGYVEKAPDKRRYQLGPMVVKLSRSVINRMPLRETAKPYLRRLVELTGECAHLAIYAQGQALYIDQVESSATLRVNADVGHMAPLHCTALGKALLAFGKIPLPDSLEKRTPNTIVTHKAMTDELEQIRRLGYAVDDEEYDQGVRCIAAPIFDFREKVVGAVGISGPAARVSLEKIDRLSRQVLQSAGQLSERLKFNR
jgi:DNA-binding IclR family transcriptional regulator